MLIMITVWVRNRLSFCHQFSNENLMIQTVLVYQNEFFMVPYLPLEIISQPLDQTDCYGNEVKFSVIISGGTGNLNYQWQRKSPNEDFENILGAEQSSLSIEKIGMYDENIDGSEYRVLISDDLGSIISDPAILHINSIIDVTPDDVNSAICNGESMSYSMSAFGDALSYQWSQKSESIWVKIYDDGNYSGTITPTLFISNANTNQSGSYRVSVTFKTLNQTDGYPTCVETSASRERNLIVKAPLKAPVVSPNQDICVNTTPAALALTVATGGFGPYLYQWKNSLDGLVWTNINNATNINYSPSLLSTTIYYMLEAKDGGTPSCGLVNSETIKIAVNPYPDPNPINPD